MVKRNLILAFESSCDETSVAVIEDGHRVLSNIVATQIASHQRFGGVVPEVAAATTLNRLPSVPRRPWSKPELVIKT